MENTTVIDWTELHNLNGKYAVPKKTSKPKLQVGSCSSTIPDEFVDLHFAKCRKTWLGLTGNTIIKGSRYLVMPEDAAIVLLIALWLQEHGSKDNRHSVRTTLAFWLDLQDRGLTNRSPNHHRIKTIRDYLSARGCIDWQENNYQPPTADNAKDGKCCRWRLDEGLAALITTGGDSVGSSFLGNGQNLQPCKIFSINDTESVYWEAAEKEIEAIFWKAA